MAVDRDGGWRWASRGVILAAALALAYQLILPPPVGMADNGDFPRVAGYFNIGAPREARRVEGFDFARFEYQISPSFHWNSGFFSSELPLVAVAYAANRVTGGGNRFDLRWLGAVHIAVLLFALWLLLREARLAGTGNTFRYGAALLALVILTDVSYVAYFNSFFSETASLLFLVLTIAAAAAASRAATPGALASFGLAASLFVWAKPQNASAGLLIALFPLLVARRHPAKALRIVAVVAAAVIAGSAVASFRLTSPIVRDSTKHNAVFYELLANSPTPEADLRELGLPAELIRYRGTHPWMTTPASFDQPEFRRLFIDRFHFSRLGVLYARHPGRLPGLIDRSAAEALAGRPPLGNFSMETGVLAGARSTDFSLWTRIKLLLAPKSGAGIVALFFAGVATIALAWKVDRGRGREFAAFLLLLWLAAAGQFLTVAITSGTIDTAKHMFVVKLTVDLVGAIGVAWVLDRCARFVVASRPATKPVSAGQPAA